MASRESIQTGIAIAAAAGAVAGGSIYIEHQLDKGAHEDLEPLLGQLVTKSKIATNDVYNLDTLQYSANKGIFNEAADEMEDKTPYPALVLKGKKLGRELPDGAFDVPEFTSAETMAKIKQYGHILTPAEVRKYVGKDKSLLTRMYAIPNVSRGPGYVTFAKDDAEFETYKEFTGALTEATKESIGPTRARVVKEIRAVIKSQKALDEALGVQYHLLMYSSDVNREIASKEAAAIGQLKSAENTAELSRTN
jgi:hypothetical protein